jgi:hypothetical protein
MQRSIFSSPFPKGVQAPSYFLTSGYLISSRLHTDLSIRDSQRSFPSPREVSNCGRSLSLIAKFRPQNVAFPLWNFVGRPSCNHNNVKMISKSSDYRRLWGYFKTADEVSILDRFCGRLKSPTSTPVPILENDIDAISVFPNGIVWYQEHHSKNTAHALDCRELSVVAPSLHRYVFTK